MPTIGCPAQEQYSALPKSQKDELESWFTALDTDGNKQLTAKDGIPADTLAKVGAHASASNPQDLFVNLEQFGWQAQALLGSDGKANTAARSDIAGQISADASAIASVNNVQQQLTARTNAVKSTMDHDYSTTHLHNELIGGGIGLGTGGVAAGVMGIAVACGVAIPGIGWALLVLGTIAAAIAGFFIGGAVGHKPTTDDYNKAVAADPQVIALQKQLADETTKEKDVRTLKVAAVNNLLAGLQAPTNICTPQTSATPASNPPAAPIASR